jgi:hypothetical protein
MSCSYTVTISPARASGIICPKEESQLELKKRDMAEQNNHTKILQRHLGLVWISLFFSLCKQLMQFLCIIINLSR